MAQVAWPEIMLITGVSTYVAVLEHMGTITFVGDSVAGLASPLLAALLLCFIGAVVSAFASSTAVLGSLIPLAVPFLQAGTGVSAIGFIAAMAVASTIVDVSPFSTNGALVLANAQGVDRAGLLPPAARLRRDRHRGRPDRPLAHLHRGAGMSLDLRSKGDPREQARPDRPPEPARLPRRPARHADRARPQPAPPARAGGAGGRPGPRDPRRPAALPPRRGLRASRWPARWSPPSTPRAPEERLAFLALLAERFGPDRAAVEAAIAAIGRDEPDAIETLHAASEPRRQELLRRLNLAPGGTAALVRMREELLKHLREHPELRRRRRRLRASLRLVVQPRLPGAAPHRLDDAGEHPREDHPLRGGARDPELGRPAQPARADRPALLRLLPPAARRRAADLRRGGADRGDPGHVAGAPRPRARADRGGEGDDGGLLLDLQLPAGPAPASPSATS